eukprot:scaffold317579_cov35-Tisochrysis_lutea.AAC.2
MLLRVKREHNDAALANCHRSPRIGRAAVRVPIVSHRESSAISSRELAVDALSSQLKHRHALGDRLVNLH